MAFSQLLMCWMPENNQQGRNVLYLKTPSSDWHPYYQSDLATAIEVDGRTKTILQDVQMADKTGCDIKPLDFSPGFHVYQSLLKEGWQLVKAPMVRSIDCGEAKS